MAGKIRAQHVPSAEQLERDRKVLELRQEGWSFARIADHPDVALHDRGSAHKAYKRALAYVMVEPATEVIKLEEARLDRLWEIAFKRAMRGKMDGVHAALRVMERRAKFRGLDHEHGLAERALALEAEKVKLMAVAFGSALDLLAQHVEVTPELRAIVTRHLLDQLRAGTDEGGNVVDEEGRPVSEGAPVPADA